jgi:hypothetical protein
MLNTLKNYPQNHIIISIRAETLVLSMKIFETYFFNQTNLQEIKKETNIKTISFYVDGKCKKDFQQKLFDLSKNFTLYINTRIVKTMSVNVKLERVVSPSVNVFIPFNRQVNFAAMGKFDDDDTNIGETIAIDACFIFFTVAMSLLAIIMIVS